MKRMLFLVMLKCNIALAQNFSASFKYLKSNILTLAMIVFMLPLAGCYSEKQNSPFIVRVKQTRCLDGFEPKVIGKCKGATAEAGIYEFRLSPMEKRALIRVVEQDPRSQSVPLFELDGCNVWDSKNWECSIGEAKTIVIYSMHNGIYSHQFISGIGLNDYFVGYIQNPGFFNF
ncbi:hypothetical protein [Undibacterium pigrum]|uniref:Lipoprotein n=1 Tax=Undibacterium pigrum TaxID=401470 RepID=A0A318J8L2_9BURK|nr:hypothetical protein [Undibacterium pigrum]PXX40238.1 hypothetical protein DFR42_10871 [Undibacterium pigrum]